MNNVYFLKNAKIIPYSLDCKEKHNNYIHGIIHTELSSSARGLVRGEEKKLLINETRLSEVSEKLKYKYDHGTSFYIGPFINQYGHLISQTLSRAWAYNEYKQIVDKIIILGRSDNDKIENMPNYVLELFSFFSLDLDKIKFITHAVEVEKLILPKQSHGIGFREPWHAKQFSSFYCSGKYIDNNIPKKIFISRRRYKLKGRLAGLDSIAEILKRNAYSEVYPEEMTVEQQIKLYVNATHIIAEEGSALHTLELIPKINAKLFLISRRSDYPTFKGLVTRVASETFSFDDVEIINTGNREANSLSISFSLHNLISILKEKSFIEDDTFSFTNIKKEIINDLASFFSK